MKKLLLKVLILGAILLLVILFVNAWYGIMYRGNFDGTDKFKTMPDRIEVCNFGSSHGQYAFNYEAFQEEYNCFNFSLSAQSLSYDLRFLKQYGDRLEEGGIAFLDVSYFSFYGKSETEGADFTSKNKRYYPILDARYIKEADFETALFTKYLPALGVENSQLLSALLGREQEDAFLQYWNHSALDIDLKSDIEAAFIRHIGDENFYEDGKRIVNQEEVNALYEMISICIEKGVQPILITTPYTEAYNQYVAEHSPEFLEEFQKMVSEIATKTGVIYVNLSDCAGISEDLLNFMDADHLNQQGAAKFTKMILDEYLSTKE